MPVKSEKPKLEENVSLTKQHSSFGAWPFHLILRSFFFGWETRATYINPVSRLSLESFPMTIVNFEFAKCLRLWQGLLTLLNSRSVCTVITDSCRLSAGSCLNQYIFPAKLSNSILSKLLFWELIKFYVHSAAETDLEKR